MPMMYRYKNLAVRLTLRKTMFVAALVAGPVGHAYAVTAAGVMTITATVASTCSVGTSSLAYGSVSSAAIQAGDIDRNGTVTVNCTTGSSYSVALGAGGGTGATFASRQMTSGSTLLNYSMYTTAARTSVWGDGTLASATVPGTGSGAGQTITVYGRIFAGQTIPSGAYTDTVAVTVTY